MTFGDIASLAIAYSDLKAVEAVTTAINANLPKTGPLGTIPASTRALDSRPRLKATPETRTAPRAVHQAAARQVAAGDRCDDHGGDHCIRAVDRYEPSSDASAAVVCLEPYKHSKSPIQPVWATMPPVPHVTTERVVKRIQRKVDLVSRGSLLDMFV